MTKYQLEINHHNKIQDDLKLNKKQSINADIKNIEMLELSAITQKYEWALKNTLEINEQIESQQRNQRYNSSEGQNEGFRTEKHKGKI